MPLFLELPILDFLSFTLLMCKLIFEQDNVLIENRKAEEKYVEKTDVRLQYFLSDFLNFSIFQSISFVAFGTHRDSVFIKIQAMTKLAHPANMACRISND